MYQVIAATNRLLSLFLIAIAFWVGAQTAQAGGVIEFPNQEQSQPAQLLGYLARPDLGLPAYLGGDATGAGPYPAVVVLHGCSGFSSHDAVIADQIASWGYVVLAVDSLTPRSIDSRCGGRNLADQALDAYAALHYLSRLAFVDPKRVAVLGGSMGGSSVLQVVDHDFAAQHSDRGFRAAIAYYPLCGAPSVMAAPTLILIGELDDTTRAALCQAMVENLPNGGAPVSLTVYPGAYHAFNVARLDPGIRTLGHRYEYNRSAAKDSETKVRAFLARYLAMPTSGKSGAH
ncbi:MAG TPA: dienelactone hydrolase family protein [Stellaceae bacterium]|nr:dienelactone hydrolase family protein [Stellaceae bacterium]